MIIIYALRGLYKILIQSVKPMTRFILFKMKYRCPKYILPKAFREKLIHRKTYLLYARILIKSGK